MSKPLPQELRILLPEDLKPVGSLKEYENLGGLSGLKKARAMKPLDVIAEVKASKLRGRGGAGFPAALKWETTVHDPSPNKYLVCNGSEGEPGTFKDRYLLRKNPYKLLEGLLIAAHAIGAKEVFIGLKEKFTLEVERVRSALKEMEQAGIAPAGYINIVLGPDEYLFGEEKALLEVIDGRGALPRIFPPYMQGVRFTPTDYNPTVVNNVETMSHLPNILSKGADWFKTIGSADTPGTMIFTLCGDVKNPGMYELPLGTPLKVLLEDIGGGPKDKKYPIKAVYSGVANRVITSEQFATPLDFGSMRSAGSGLGSAGFFVYDESVCIVHALLRLSEFLAKESCGQCQPCNMGCRIITNHLRRIEEGYGTKDDLDAISHECGKITNQTRCFLPVEEAALVSSTIQKFSKEFESHLGKTCPHSRVPFLPKIIDFDEYSKVFKFDDKG
ncbi:MAG: NADH-ubiquinone oxidoreductase-F iron-sulfur binding region domain-containing protein [Candidatus Omnitrophota bacterium]